METDNEVENEPATDRFRQLQSEKVEREPAIDKLRQLQRENVEEEPALHKIRQLQSAIDVVNTAPPYAGGRGPKSLTLSGFGEGGETLIVQTSSLLTTPPRGHGEDKQIDLPSQAFRSRCGEERGAWRHLFRQTLQSTITHTHVNPIVNLLYLDLDLCQYTSALE